ncbi:hypothetical protein ACFSUK_11370 [Sphingobium scionense]
MLLLWIDPFGKNDAQVCRFPSATDAELPALKSPSHIDDASLKAAESLKTYLAVRGDNDGEIARTIARLKVEERRRTLLEVLSIFDENIDVQARRLNANSHIFETNSAWILRVRRTAIANLLSAINSEMSAS